MFRIFLVRILIQKDSTDDKVLGNKFYISETKKKKDRNDGVLQICCNLRDLRIRLAKFFEF